MYRVALLEDDEWVIKGIEASFDWSKYDMEVVGRFLDPINLLEYLKTNDIDVVFTDINMPNMTGLELIHEVKSGLGRKDILFVIISAYDDYEFMRKAISLGVVDYCKKPIEKEKTDETLERVIDELKKIGKQSNHTEARDFDTLIAYINDNFDKNLHLEDLSRKFYFNPNYICMLFRRRLDTTFIEYIKTIRMKKAKELFDSGNFTVSEVSSGVGYRDYSYFHKTFSAYYGITPAQYKKNVLQMRELNEKIDKTK